MKQLLKLASILILIILFSCNKNDDAPNEPDLSEAGHPRILLLEGEEKQIRDLIDSDDTWKKMHFAILEKSTDLSVELEAVFDPSLAKLNLRIKCSMKTRNV